MTKNLPTNVSYLDKVTSRKVKEALERSVAQLPDSLSAWITCYLRMVVVGVRSQEVTRKITLHLQRFQAFLRHSTEMIASPSVSAEMSSPGTTTWRQKAWLPQRCTLIWPPFR